jgi:glutamate N-acetyltransferase/amino-acid N-acetyltransferase
MKKRYALPGGFYSSGIYGGIKKIKKPDMGLIYSETGCNAAVFFTKNKLVANHIIYDKPLIKNKIRAVFVNSGNANVFNGPQGLKDAKAIAAAVSDSAEINLDSVLVSSTGKISLKMPVKKILSAIPALVLGLDKKDKVFPRAIMTTDLAQKVYTEQAVIGGKKITVTGAAKGSGMISVNMATMLAYVMTDAAVAGAALHAAAKEAVEISFNRVTVDGDMSPNDTLFVLANGTAQNREIRKSSPDYKKLVEIFKKIFYALSEDIAYDGEGATKFIKITVKNAKTEKQAGTIARSIANSPLVKTAFFGQSLNYGRIISAAGSTGENFEVNRLGLKFNGIQVFKNQKLVNQKQLQKIMKGRRIDIELNVNAGNKEYYLLTADFSYDYVRINADYT